MASKGNFSKVLQQSVTRQIKPNEFAEKKPITKQRRTTKEAKANSSSSTSSLCED